MNIEEEEIEEKERSLLIIKVVAIVLFSIKLSVLILFLMGMDYLTQLILGSLCLIDPLGWYVITKHFNRIMEEEDDNR